MVNDRIADPIINRGEFVHGFTYSGHPVAAAVAMENVRILRDEKIVETAGTDTGPYLQARLRELADHLLVGEIRGIGMIAGIELVEDKAARKSYDAGRKVGQTCRDLCTDNGVVVRAVRDVIVLSPPLIISRDEIDVLVNTLAQCLDETAKTLGL
jgi:putrescine aminotransferase